MKPINKAILLAVFSVVGLFVTCRLQAQSGSMYMPVIIDTQGVGQVTFDSVHVVQAGNQVFVSGRFAVSSNVTGRRNRVLISVPVPSDFQNSYVFLTGQMSVHDNGFHDPEGGNFLQNSSGMMFEWWARANTASIIDFYFVYTIKTPL
jgi:hypothetical protein